MMYKLICIFCLWLSAISCEGQLYDAQWVIAPNVSVLDFRNDTLINYPIAKYMDIWLTSASICDDTGALLYYTNGKYIADKNGDTLYNGANLSPCPYTSSHTSLNIHQAALFIPKPGNNRFYYLFHFSNDTLSDSRPGTLYYSVIDRQANGGLGAVIEKNVVFGKGKFRGGGMSACKHANGRDYWIIIGGSNNNTFNKYLFTADTIVGPFKQSIGPVYHLPDDVAYSCFSLDGTKFATTAFEGYLGIFDFDRCSGLLSNPLQVFNNVSNDTNQPITGGTCVAFSPNGRMLYIPTADKLKQYDITLANPIDSVQLIYKQAINDLSGIDYTCLALNGKIYASTWNGGSYYGHVINKPDLKGVSCGFVDTGFYTLTANVDNLPNMINYRLGALLGSGCDTIINSTAKEVPNSQQPRILPNPADKFVYVEMPTQGNFILNLINEQGQLIERKETNQIDVFNTENLASGIYFLNTIEKKKSCELNSVKIIVQHGSIH